MNPFTAIRNIFKRRNDGPSQGNQRWLDGYAAFQRGKDLYAKGDLQRALSCFDEGIALSFEGDGIYGLRGSCLQSLDFDLDAIDDLSRAIASEPEDGNHYYMRSLSKGATGDCRGRVSDLEEAIRLATVQSTLNKTYDEYAKEKGWNRAVDMFRADLVHANLDLEMQVEDERRHREHPGLFTALDLASRKRAQAKRRATHENLSGRGDR